MNAELALFLVEEGMTLSVAKDIASTTPSSTAELALTILEHAPQFPLQQARDIAARFTQDLAPSPVPAPHPSVRGNLPSSDDVAVVHHVPVVGPDGLTDIQRNAVGTVGLCPNCQQPNNRHLPGCARASGEDAKAITKGALPPAV